MIRHAAAEMRAMLYAVFKITCHFSSPPCRRYADAAFLCLMMPPDDFHFFALRDAAAADAACRHASAKMRARA